MRKCGDCEFWTDSDDPNDYLVEDEEQSLYGTCRRFPPTPNARSVYSIFPRTEKNDWCGEYQPREE